jgi:NDP-sugar pyrophosphorylase family protein
MYNGLILAAGKGERMKEYSLLPKHCLEYKGAPILVHNINFMKQYCDELIITISDTDTVTKQMIPENGFKYTSVDNNNPIGVQIGMACKELKPPILMSLGDCYFNGSLHIFDFPKLSKLAIWKDPPLYEHMQHNYAVGNDDVDIMEKPRFGIGLYLLYDNVIKYLLENLNFNFMLELINMIRIKSYKFSVMYFYGDYRNINTKEDLE